jgi:hypothetical protein
MATSVRSTSRFRFTGACTVHQRVCGDQQQRVLPQLGRRASHADAEDQRHDCNDPKICTSVDTCQSGVCVGAVGGGLTPTNTPIGPTRQDAHHSGGSTPSPTAGGAGCPALDGNEQRSDQIRSTMNFCGPR